MEKPLNQTFLHHVNQNLGIAHKVARAYFDTKEEREDVIQEMMFQLWRSYGNFNGTSKFSTWMYSVCLNTAMTYHRKAKKVSPEYLHEAHLNIAENSNPNEEVLALMFQTISTLSPVNKAITLLYLEDLSYDEIARITGVSKANVSVRLVRIKNELEEKMKKLI